MYDKFQLLQKINQFKLMQITEITILVKYNLLK